MYATRKPFVPSNGRAYVLPRSGPGGIPLVSVIHLRQGERIQDRRPQT